MTVHSIANRRLLVVGASAGIGRAFAAQAIAGGASVVAVARRGDRLAELAAGGSCTPVAVDIARATDIDRLVEELASLGTFDLVLFSAGSAPLRRVADTTTEDWDAVMRVNVIAFNAVVRAILPHLSPTAVVAALSSETVDQPRQALTAYGASKAALEASIRGWRLEHPGRRFTCIRVGATQPTEFGDAFDGELLGPVLGQWVTHGLLQEAFMDTTDVAAVLLDSLAVLVDHPGVCMEDVVLRSPSAVVGSAEPAISGVREPPGATDRSG
jgi:NADP-dependent 3-hydroxy acid dehydrogenase YdfG